MIAIKAHKLKESKVAPSGNTPCRRMEEFSFVHLSSRAREIAEGREELLGLLRDVVPESDYELSLTDIVEKGSVVDARSSASKEKAAAAAAHGGEPIDPKTRAAKEIKRKIMVSNRSFRSASDGVLLNVYLPASLTRSLTAPRMSRGAVHRATTECNKIRDTKPTTLGCWSALWLRGKPRRGAAAKIR